MPTPIAPIFDTTQLLRQKIRATNALQKYQFLHETAAEHLCEHLDCMQRQYLSALNLYAFNSALTRRLEYRGGVNKITTTTMLPPHLIGKKAVLHIAEHETLPFQPHLFDMIASSLALHWVNDVPQLLTQICRLLAPNGLFIANLFGAGTLDGLRKSMAEADRIHYNGIAPRVIPFVEVKTLGMLLQRTGFDMPITDSETIRVQYPDLLTLLHDLRYMGEGNALLKRSKKPVSRAWLADVEAYYRAHFSDEEGGIIATFELLTATALAPQS